MLASIGVLKHGDRAAREISRRIGGTVADRATLALLQKSARDDGMIVKVASDRSEWMFSLASTAADTTQNLVVTPSDAPSTGAWLRVDNFVDLKLPIAFGTADATALFTVPAAFNLLLLRAYWEVIASFTGGAGAIGVSSNNAAFATKGDILGGATGDVAATLVQTGSPYKGGTLGAKFGTNGLIALVPANIIRLDVQTAGFTAGNGFVHVAAQIIN